ncbi:MAG: DUF58 domain-containing protein, partial [Flavobacteriales bacterium]
VHAAAAIALLLQKQRDAVGLSFFSEDIELLTEAKSNEAHHRFLFQQMESLLEKSKEEEQKKTFAVDALHKIAEKIHKRSLVIIFSDMMDNSDENEELFTALQHLRHNKHEVLLFHVADREKELNFEYENRPYTFIDLETGEEVKANPNEIKKQYLESMNQYKKDLMLKCGQYGIDFVECDIARGFDKVLFEYLTKRSKLY